MTDIDTTSHLDSGARDLRPVLEHDFGHIREVAERVSSGLAEAWLYEPVVDADQLPGSPAQAAARSVATAAASLGAQVARGSFTELQLLALEDVPALLGDVLSSIDPERAR